MAAGPDGLCALCRSESLPPPRDYSKWVLGGLLAAVLAVSAGTLAYRAVASSSRGTILPEVRSLPSAASVALLASGQPPEQPAAANATANHEGESIPLAEPLPAPAALAVEPPLPAPSAARGGPLEKASSRPTPTQAELQAALTATPIVMYGTAWCGVCRKARQFMTENGLRYQEIDADQTPGAWDKVGRLTGRRAVPVIVVDGEVAGGGLSPERVMRLVARSMERRLGVTGIRFQ